jgi:ABC-2 type transport system permease protein
MERRSQARAESGAFVFIVLASLVVLNVLAVKVFHVRFDLTKRRLYSLSEGTKRTLGRLTDNLTVTVYWTPDQPPPANDDERLLREQLDEYTAAAHGRVEVRWIRTDNDERKRAAESASCSKRILQTVREGQAQAVEVYRCITFSYLRANERIDFVNPNVEGLEYEVTSIIKKMIDPERTIGFLTGHDEATPDTAMPYLSQIMTQMHVGYTTRNIDLHGGDDEIPADVKGLIINNPTRAISERELRRINAYLMRGGAVAVFASGVNVTGTDTRPSGANAEHNLGQLLSGYGITLRQNLVLDARASDAVAEIDQGRARIRLFTFPAIAEDGLNQYHSSVFRLPFIVTPFVSQLDVDRSRYCDARDEEEAKTKCGDRPALITIGRTSDISVVQQGSFELDAIDLLMRRQTVFGRPGGHGPFTVAVAAVGPLRSAFQGDGASAPTDGGVAGSPITAPAAATRDHPARLLVVASGKMFGIDQLREIAPLQGAMPTNVQMLFNTFDWLSQDSDLLAVRAKNVSEPELATTSETKKNIFKWGSILGLPALVGILGWFLMGLRARRRAEIKL